MAEIILICTAAVIMAVIYSRSRCPKTYAFVNTAAGVISLAACEMLFSGSLDEIDIWDTALSAIFGVPGTMLHALIKLI